MVRVLFFKVIRLLFFQLARSIGENFYFLFKESAKRNGNNLVFFLNSST